MHYCFILQDNHSSTSNSQIPSDRSSDSGRPRSPYSVPQKPTARQSNSLPNHVTHTRGSHDEVFPDYSNTADQQGSEDNEELQEEVIVVSDPT